MNIVIPRKVLREAKVIKLKTKIRGKKVKSELKGIEEAIEVAKK